MTLYEVILLDSAIYACLLAVLCTGLTLTYKVTKVPNFAHTSFAVLGMYMALIVTKLFESSTYLSMPLAFVVSGATAFALYYGILQGLQKKNSSYLVLIIATLAFDFMMLGVLNIIADVVSDYQVTSRDFTLRSFDVIVFDVPAVLLVSIVTLAGMVGGLYYLLYRTKFGISMRAAIENASLAESRGINIYRVFGVSWFLSGGLAGVAGALLSLWFQGDPSLGMFLLPSVFAGSIVGGFSSIYGAVIGGMLVGFSEIIGTSVLATTIGAWIVAYRPIIPFLFIVATLMLFPVGIAGLRRGARDDSS